MQAFQQLGADPTVIRNDREEVLELATSGKLERVCLSPGPSNPENAGYCLEFLARLPKEIPVLGVCLGHQTLGHFAGAPVERAQRIMHGKTSRVQHDNTGIFAGLPDPFTVCRYHSLIVPAHSRRQDRRDRAHQLGRSHGTPVQGPPMARGTVPPGIHPHARGPQLLQNFLNIQG